MKNVNGVLCAFYGDEWKGKIIDCLSSETDYAVTFRWMFEWMDGMQMVR